MRQHEIGKTLEIHLVLIMPTEWLLQVCKNNSSLIIMLREEMEAF